MWHETYQTVEIELSGSTTEIDCSRMHGGLAILLRKAAFCRAQPAFIWRPKPLKISFSPLIVFDNRISKTKNLHTVGQTPLTDD
jgi:hypothetical protein